MRLGIVGFGGPLALIANMQRDLVERRAWMPPETFARAFALIKAMPGPVAFMTSVYLGRHRAGWKGGTAAAIGLIGPSFFMMVLFGVFYDRWRGIHGASAFLVGIQAAALGVILSSLKGLGFAHRKKPIFWILAGAAALLTYVEPAYEPLLIVGSGTITALILVLRGREGFSLLRNVKLSIAGGFAGLGNRFAGTDAISSAGAADVGANVGVGVGANVGVGVGANVGVGVGANATATTATATTATATTVTATATTVTATGTVAASASDLFLSCFKAGAFVFGSGLAIVPLMEHDFVQRLGWLTHTEFMDALAFGQVTPGPVVITATFIGYKALGFQGALLATIAIFLAPFIHMMTWFPRALDRLSRLSWIGAFLTGAIAAVTGAIFATVVKLSLDWTDQPLAYLFMAAALAAALFAKLPVWTVIPAGGLVGYFLL